MTGAGILGTLTVIMGANTTGLVQAQVVMTDLEKTTTSSLNRMAQRARTFGYLASVTITAPMVMAAKSSLNMAKDFEYSMQKIVGLAGVGQASVDEWKQSVLNLSREVGKTPQELADALYYISSSGIKGAEAMDVLKLSAQAAEAGLGQTQDVANILTSTLNAYAGTGVNAAYITDVLVAAIREGKAEASGFTTAIGQLIPIASNLGVSFDQVAGAMAAITLTGSSAANAAVYLKGVFNSLMIAHKDGGKALESIEISYAGLRDMLKSPQGLIQVMQKFRDVQMKLGDEAVKNVLPNIRGMTAFMSVAGKNFAYNTELMNRVTKASGSLGIAMAAVSNTIKVKMDKALASVQVSLISLGSNIAVTFLPILDKLVKWLDKVVKWFDSLSEEQKRHKLVMLAWVAAAGPVALMISTLIYSITGLVSAFKWLKKELTILGAFFTKNPFLLAVTGAYALYWAIINLGKAAKETTRIYQGLYDIINKMSLGNEDFAIIQAKMTSVGTMGEKELGNLQNLINQRLFLLEDQNSKLAVIGDEQIDKDKEVIALRAKIAQANLDIERTKGRTDLMPSVQEEWLKKYQKDLGDATFALSTWIDQRKFFVKFQQDQNKKEITDLTEYSKQVQSNLKSITDATAKSSAELQSFLDAQAKLKEQAEESAKALERLDEAWLEIDRDIYQKKYGKVLIFRPGDILKTIQTKMDSAINTPTAATFMPSLGTDLELAQRMNEEMQKAKVFASTLTNIFSDMFMSFGEGFNKMIQSVIDGLKRLAAEILARVAVFAILTILSQGTSLFATGIKKFIEGGFTDFVFKNLGRGMASGGTVPPGYPNDSYPARLSSGEMVVPPGKLDNVMSPRNINITVDGKVSGKDLALVLRRVQVYN